MSDVIFDLLGDPIPDGFGKRGRPPHLVTDEKRLKVRLLTAFTTDLEEIAAGLGITVPTLKKHYFRELADRSLAMKRLKATLLLDLYKGSAAGNASSTEKLFKRIDKHDLELLSEVVKGNREDRPEKLGKKERQQVEAAGVDGRYRVRSPDQLDG